MMTPLSTKELKEKVASLGADVCGIAPVERFNHAPAGFHPRDIFPAVRSAVVLGRQIPGTAIDAANCVPYTHINGIATGLVDNLTFELSLWLQRRGIGVVAVPSDDPFEHWEKDRQHGRGILSLRHAAWLAGLGELGKNTLLLHETFGNMLQLGAVLVDADLEPDPLAEPGLCPPQCRLCLEACPVGALNGKTVDQELCRPLSNFQHPRGFTLKRCGCCRKVCPVRQGRSNNAGSDKNSQ